MPWGETPIPQRLAEARNQRPFFLDQGVAERLHPKYVAWVDLMGANSAMRRSIVIAAIAIGKLHVAALNAKHDVGRDNVRLYPVIDGVYITADRKGPLLRTIAHMMRSLALDFCLAESALYKFMLRGAVTYGPLCEGEDLMTERNYTLVNNAGHSENICLGIPMAQAYDAESNASPFGIWIHESARAFCPEGGTPITFTHWPWWNSLDDTDFAQDLVSTLHAGLCEYLDWCDQHSTSILYPPDAIARHRGLVDQYFTFDRSVVAPAPGARDELDEPDAAETAPA